MPRYLVYILLLVAGMSRLTPLWSQADTLCISNTTGMYHVQGWSGSTFTWNTQGNGAIVNGQGNDTVVISWNAVSGIYRLEVVEISIEGCAGLPRFVDVVILPNSIRTVDVSLCTAGSYQLPDGTMVTSSGVYPVTLTASNGCDSVITTTVRVDSVITIVLNTRICNGSEYILPDGSAVSEAGVYPVTLSSSAGCDSIITTNLSITNPTQTTINAAICEGESYILPNGTSINQAGVYPVTLSGVSGCDSLITTTLTVNPIQNRTVNQSICSGNTYSLPDGQVVDSAGSYQSVFQGVFGCDSIITTNLSVIPQLVLEISSSAGTTLCEGSSTELSVVGAADYSWNPTLGLSVDTGSSVTARPINAIRYYVTGTTGQCSVTDSISLAIAPLPSIAVTQTPDSVCAGGTIQLIASGGTSYTWSPSIGLSSTVNDTTIATVTQEFAYVVVGSSGQCSSSDTAYVHVLASPQLVIQPQNSGICLGDSLVLSASGAGSYLWSSNDTIVCVNCGSIQVSPDTATSYTVIGILNTCKDTAYASIQVSPAINPTIEGDSVMCANDLISLQAAGGGSYLWNTGDTTSTIQTSPAESGNQFVIVNAGFCTDTAFHYVLVNPKPDLTLSDDTTIVQGGIANLIASGGNQYFWSPSMNLSCDNCPTPDANPLETTTYCVRVTNFAGCDTTSCVEVKVEIICDQLFIPNVFAPGNGGDVMNECFRIYGTNCITELKFNIFNRWGELVFSSVDQGDCWDGKFNGKDENTGVFVYYVDAVLINGDKVSKKGNITLMR
jgi:gliding motility-associated-like protein